MFKKKFLILILLLSQTTFAAKYIDLSFVGAMSIFRPTFEQSSLAVTYSGKSAFGFGGLLGFNVTKLFGLEFGAFFMPYKLSQTLLGAEVTTTYNTIHFPALLRITSLPIISFGFGGYLAQGMGDISVDTAGFSTPVAYDTANISKTDYGLIASVAAEIPIGPLLRIVGDLRYQAGLKNTSSTAGSTLKFNALLFLLGLKLTV